MIKSKRSTIIAWAFCIFFAVAIAIDFVIWITGLAEKPTTLNVADNLLWNVVSPLVFAVLAILVIMRQPGNRVGWLMMVIALGGVVPVSIIDSMAVPPETISPGLWLLLWYYGWGWIPTMFPIFLIPLHFPTGRPPSRRWNWVNYLAIGMAVFFIFSSTFGKTIETTNWTITDPFLGLISNEFWNGPFIVFWFFGLFVLVTSSVASLFFRYRKANYEMRQQIKWLFYACALFAVIYVGAMIIILNQWGDSSSEASLGGQWGNLVFSLSILVIPAAIGFSILRYRLYDIDIIIRKTLQYALITSLLSLVYFGGVALLQALLSGVEAQSSPIIIVLTTLAIAALFTPLRRRTQDFIDRRFYRQKYDAEKALSDFAAFARSETDLAQLSNHLAVTVQDTLHPIQVSLWMKPAARKPAPNPHTTR